MSHNIVREMQRAATVPVAPGHPRTSNPAHTPLYIGASHSSQAITTTANATNSASVRHSNEIMNDYELELVLKRMAARDSMVSGVRFAAILGQSKQMIRRIYAHFLVIRRSRRSLTLRC